MKKIIISLVAILIFKIGFSQNGSPLYPITQNLGSSSSLVDVKGGQRINGAFVLGHFVDTAAANAIPYVKNFANGLITTDTSLVWLRSYDAKKWLLMPTQGRIVNGDSINYLVDVNRPPGQLNVYGKFFNGISAYSRLLYTDSIGSGGGGITNADNGLVKNSSGFVGLDSAGVNPLDRDVLIIPNETNIRSFQIGQDGDGGNMFQQIKMYASNFTIEGNSASTGHFDFDDSNGSWGGIDMNFSASGAGHNILASDSIRLSAGGISKVSLVLKNDSLIIINLPPSTVPTDKMMVWDSVANKVATRLIPSGGGGSGITVGTTTITSGTNGRIGYNNSGVYGEKAVTGTGDVVLATSPTLVTPILGTPTSATLTNATGLPITTGLTGGNWKTIYTNGSGAVTELALGSAGKVLTTNGTSSAPTWETPASGVTTMAAIGATPNANGATISGSTLNLQPVSASFGGVVTTSAQTLGAGIKTFSDNVIISNVSNPKLAITNGTQYTQIFTGTSLSIFQFPNSTKFGIQAATGAADNGTSGTYSAIFEGSSNNALFGGVAYNASITPSASLEVRSTTKGFLPPKMTGTQAEAISSPAEGLMIYSTDGSGSVITSKGWWGYDGSAWVKLN